MAAAALEFFGHPSDELQIAAVTGTNGKTTTAFLHLLDPRGRGPQARPARDDRVPDRRRDQAGDPHDARGDRPPARVPRDARRRRPKRRDGGDLPRLAARPARGNPLRVARVHEPHAGPPRPARDDGELLRGEAQALPRRAPAGGDQRRRSVGPQARRGPTRRAHVRLRRRRGDPARGARRAST